MNPTIEIATWLRTNGGLPAHYADSFNRAIGVFLREGRLELPTIKGIEDKVKDGIAPKTLANPITEIEEYDQQLLVVIDRLRKDISNEEDMSKDFMRSHGAPEKIIKDVVQKARNENNPISFYGLSNFQFQIHSYLVKMAPIYKTFSFRVWIPSIEIRSPSITNVILEDNSLLFDTRPLDNEERREYEKQLKSISKLHYYTGIHTLYKYYPNAELMGLVSNMLKKYGTRILTENEYRDTNMDNIRLENLKDNHPITPPL